MEKRDHVSFDGNAEEAREVLKFGEDLFPVAKRRRIASRLREQLPRSDVCTRPGPGGVRLTYLEGWRAVDKANDIFGFNGWSCSVSSLELDFVEEKPGGNGRPRFTACASAVVRVTLRDGSFHEDSGSGLAEGMPSKGEAIGKAKKEAVTDARKRALKNFGNALGNSLYDREHLKRLAKSKCEAITAPAVKAEGFPLGGSKDCDPRRALNDVTNRTSTMASKGTTLRIQASTTTRTELRSVNVTSVQGNPPAAAKDDTVLRQALDDLAHLADDFD
uniref:Uncharacterized protein n=1 Tax=Compsopogon caeruleus TaxID=31354 RepID=A0A7S1TED3_9RHOD|mmetsp:Transcript_2359/g.4073  ORF Transcript_2359/g.4073 Transcript_2359/m.4073 type:complete len:275 (+) Transcript_2359:204-1028(+)